MEKIDLFSTNFQFNFKNKTNYSTGFSLTLSLLFIILSLIILSWNLELMFTRTNIIVNSYMTTVGTDDKIIFNETNSFFGFSFYDENMNEIEITRSATPIDFTIKRDSNLKEYLFQYVNATQIQLSSFYLPNAFNLSTNNASIHIELQPLNWTIGYLIAFSNV